MRRPWALAGTAVLLSGLLGCTHPQPRPIEEAALLRRGQSRIDGGVTVTVTALNPEESEQLVGFDVAAAGIQPVWVKVVNREKRRWYVPPITIDSEYYSPLEVAWKIGRAHV